MKTKTIPFDIEIAKKIQSRELQGRIVTDTKLPVKILCFDRKVPEYIVVGLVNGYSIFCYSKDGVSEPQPERITHTIYIELSEEAPKYEFKVGDIVKVADGDRAVNSVGPIIAPIYPIDPKDNRMKWLVVVEKGVCASIILEENLELASEKEKEIYKNIKVERKYEFKPFDKVLVRQSDKDDWRVAFYSHFNPEENLHVTAWLNWYQCIPYEGNEHLVGTTNKPKED